jgi:hypothetical protein
MVPRTVDSRYRQIAESPRSELHRLGANTLLPSEPQLACRFGVSRVTICHESAGLSPPSSQIKRWRSPPSHAAYSRLGDGLRRPVRELHPAPGHGHRRGPGTGTGETRRYLEPAKRLHVLGLLDAGGRSVRADRLFRLGAGERSVRATY